MKLRDTFWLWGHPEGRYNNLFGNTGISRMTPMEACLYLGIRNTFMVPVEVPINRRQYNKSFTTLRSVGWECFGADENPEKIEQIIAEAKEFPNIKTTLRGCASACTITRRIPLIRGWYCIPPNSVRMRKRTGNCKRSAPRLTA